LAESEDDWTRWVLDYATRVARPAWEHYHTRNSRGSRAGFPDWVLWRERVIFVELKSEGGRVKREQWAVIDGLRAAGAEVHIWRPSMRATVAEVLR